jgi:hypothetical protein
MQNQNYEYDAKRLLIEVRMIRAILMILLQVKVFSLLRRDTFMVKELYQNFTNLHEEYQNAIKL